MFVLLKGNFHPFLLLPPSPTLDSLYSNPTNQEAGAGHRLFNRRSAQGNNHDHRLLRSLLAQPSVARSLGFS